MIQNPCPQFLWGSEGSASINWKIPKFCLVKKVMKIKIVEQYVQYELFPFKKLVLLICYTWAETWKNILHAVNIVYLWNKT